MYWQRARWLHPAAQGKQSPTPATQGQGERARPGFSIVLNRSIWIDRSVEPGRGREMPHSLPPGDKTASRNRGAAFPLFALPAEALIDAARLVLAAVTLLTLAIE